MEKLNLLDLQNLLMRWIELDLTTEDLAKKLNKDPEFVEFYLMDLWILISNSVDMQKPIVYTHKLYKRISEVAENLLEECR